MFDNLYVHQRKNYKINYQFRNKYFIIFPFYFVFLCLLALVSQLLSLFRNKQLGIEGHLFLTFSQNQQKIARIFDLNNTDLNLNFSEFAIRSEKKNFCKNILLFSSCEGLDVFFLLKILTTREYKFFRMNWFRVCNLVFIEAILKKIKGNGKIVIIANDHSIYNLFVINWCKLNEVETMYIQHAPVSDKFPPLRCNYNVLFSKSSEDHYSKASPIRVKYEIFSDFRLIKFLGVGRVNSVKNNTILVCTNQLDSISKVRKFVDYLVKEDFEITIRKHPLDRRKWDLVSNEVSNNSLEEDLSNHNIILCNETALFIEAAVCKKLAYKCKFSEFFDNYGFIKNGFIRKEYLNPEQVHNDIKTKVFSYDENKLLYYTGDLKKYKTQLDSINSFLLNYKKNKNEHKKNIKGFIN